MEGNSTVILPRLPRESIDEVSESSFPAAQVERVAGRPRGGDTFIDATGAVTGVRESKSSALGSASNSTGVELRSGKYKKSLVRLCAGQISELREEAPILVSAAACSHCRSSRCCLREAGVTFREVKICDAAGASALRKRWKSSLQWSPEASGASDGLGFNRNPRPISNSGFAVVVPVIFTGDLAVAGAERIREWVAERKRIGNGCACRACVQSRGPRGDSVGSPSPCCLGNVLQASVCDVWYGCSGSGTSHSRSASLAKQRKLHGTIAREGEWLSKVSASCAMVANLLEGASLDARGRQPCLPWTGAKLEGEQLVTWRGAADWAASYGVQSPHASKGANLFGFGGQDLCLHGHEVVSLVAASLLFGLVPAESKYDGARAAALSPVAPSAARYSHDGGSSYQDQRPSSHEASAAFKKASNLAKQMVRRGMLVRAGKSGLLPYDRLDALALHIPASARTAATLPSHGRESSSAASAPSLLDGYPGLVDCACEYGTGRPAGGTNGGAVASARGNNVFPGNKGSSGEHSLWRFAADEALLTGAAALRPTSHGYTGVAFAAPQEVPQPWTRAVEGTPACGGNEIPLLRNGLTLPAAASRECLVSGLPLNCAAAYAGPPVDPLQLAKDLHSRYLELLEDSLSMCGHYVDYGRMRAGSALAAYVQQAAALQACDPSALPPAHRAAFFLNLYNALCLHALALLCTNPESEAALAEPGHAATRGAEAPAATLSAWGRRKLFGSGGVSYRIGPWKYTLDDIEHGVLRGNKSPPSVLPQWMCGQPFAAGDARQSNALARGGGTDCRVHFALVCGARACPPLRLYDAGDLEVEAEEETAGTPAPVPVVHAGSSPSSVAAAGEAPGQAREPGQEDEDEGEDTDVYGPRSRRRRSASMLSPVLSSAAARDTDRVEMLELQATSRTTAYQSLDSAAQPPASGAGCANSLDSESSSNSGAGPSALGRPRQRSASTGSGSSGTSVAMPQASMKDRVVDDTVATKPSTRSVAQGTTNGLPGLDSPLGKALDLAAEAFLSDPRSLDVRLGLSLNWVCKSQEDSARKGGSKEGGSGGSAAGGTSERGNGRATDAAVLWAWAASMAEGDGAERALERAIDAAGACATASGKGASCVPKAGSVHVRMSKLFSWYMCDFGGSWNGCFGLGAAVGWMEDDVKGAAVGPPGPHGGGASPTASTTSYRDSSERGARTGDTSAAGSASARTGSEEEEGSIRRIVSQTGSRETTRSGLSVRGARSSSAGSIRPDLGWRPCAGQRNSYGAIVRFAFRYGPPPVRAAIASALGWVGSGLAAAAARTVRAREQATAQQRKGDYTRAPIGAGSMVGAGAQAGGFLHGTSPASSALSGKWAIEPVSAQTSRASSSGASPGAPARGSCGKHGCSLVALGLLKPSTCHSKTTESGRGAGAPTAACYDFLGPIAPDGLPRWLPANCPALDGEYTRHDVVWKGITSSESDSDMQRAPAPSTPGKVRAVRVDFFEYDWRSNAAS